MLLIKLIRKLGRLLRGGAHARDIFLGALLGMLIGFVPGVNLTLVAGVFVLLILNANFGLAMMGFALGKILCLALAPVTFQIGYFVIHRVGLEGVFRFFAETPVLALLNLHVYCLTGGLLAGAITGVVFGMFAAKLIVALRMGILEATTRSERMQKLAKNRLVRLVLRFVFGKQKEELAEILKKKPRLFRKAGIAIVVVLAVIFVALELVLLDYVVKSGLVAGLSSAVGAEVDVRKADLSLASGKLDIEGLQVTDPDKPEQNLFQAERILADMSVSDLLAKRFVMDAVEVSDAKMGAKRQQPGRVFRKEKPETGPQPEDALAAYLEQAKSLRSYLEKAYDYLEKAEKSETVEKRKEQREKEKSKLAEIAATRGYFALSARSLIAERPAWLVRRLTVDKISAREGMTPQKVEGTEISSNPALNPKPMSIKLFDVGSDEPKVAVELNLQQAGARNEIKLNLANLDVGNTIKLSDKAPVDVESAKADIRADGYFSADSLQIPFEVDVKDLKAKPRQGKAVLGLDPKTAQEIFRSLEEVTIFGTVEGSLLTPLLKIDEKKTLAGLKEALVKAGKAELARRADEQIEKLGKEATKEAEKVLKEKLPGDLKEKLPKGIGELLPGLGGKKKDKEDEK